LRRKRAEPEITAPSAYRQHAAADDVDDAAMPLLEHWLDEAPNRLHNAEHIDLEHRLPVAVLRVERLHAAEGCEQSLRDERGAIHEDVRGSESLGDRPIRGVHLGVVRDVHRYRHSLPSLQLLPELVRSFPRLVGGDHPGPGSQQAVRDRLADATRSARNHGHLAVDIPVRTLDRLLY